MRNDNIWTKMCKKRILLVILTSMCLLVGGASFAQNNDEDQWWFNVELIIFKRTLLPTNGENFDQARFDLNTADANNLLYLTALQNAKRFSPYLAGLPQCATDTFTPERFGANINFEFVPNTSTNKGVLVTEQTQMSGFEQDANAAYSNVSNKQLLDQLVAPLDAFMRAQALKSAPIAQESLSNPSEISLIKEKSAKQSASDSRQQSSLSVKPIVQKLMSINKELTQLARSSASLRCHHANSLNQAFTQFGVAPIGPMLVNKSSEFAGGKQVLSANDLVMQDYAKKVFQQRDIKGLLHTAWRQEVAFGVNNAQYIRVRAGDILESKQNKNYAQWEQQYQQAYSGDESINEVNLFDALAKAIEGNESVNWLVQESGLQNSSELAFSPEKQYEIDGKIKVYLDYVNQVPYLHVDSQFNHFTLNLDEDGNSRLTPYPFDQRRRVISKQIHYFDHPAFGIIIRLERFTPPVNTEAIMGGMAN